MPVFVNGAEITDEQIFREMQHHPADNADVAMQLAAEALTIRELLLQDAVALKLAQRSEGVEEEPLADDERIEKLLNEVIKLPQLDDASIRRYYDQNLAAFTKNGVLTPFEDVQSAIAEFLRGTSWQTAVQQYIKILVGQAKIIGLELEGADSMLVQ